MRISTLRNRLMCQGWHEIKGNTIERWYMGDALISLERDYDNSILISLPDGNNRKLAELKKVEFTSYRVIFRWIDDREWFITY